MRNVWFTADTHFGHSKIIEFCKKTRPCAESEMDDVLIDKWNSVVKDNDVIYVLGDFCWKRNADYLKCLVYGQEVILYQQQVMYVVKQLKSM